MLQRKGAAPCIQDKNARAGFLAKKLFPFFSHFPHMDIHMFYHRFHTFGARIHMFNFCSNKRLKSFFIITFFLAGVFVDITECEARCLEHTDIG